jgi:hypothetical protein
MKGLDIGFPPLKIDSGKNIHVVTGVSGELIKLNNDLEAIGNISKPFPSSIVSSAILGDKWIGAWVEGELRQARMAALNINDEWQDGVSKAELRNSSRKSQLHPESNSWSQLLDTIPTALSEIGGNLCFSSSGKGIYKINSDCKEIWRAEIPKWWNDKKIENQDMIVGFVQTKEGLVSISQAGGVAIFDVNGVLIQTKIINLPEIITGFTYDEKNGWFIKLNGKCFATMRSIQEKPKIHRTTGPIYHVISENGAWKWTGWRHDGMMNQGVITTKSRPDIGVGIIDNVVLTNNGKWDELRI